MIKKRALTILVPKDSELVSLLQAVCVRDAQGNLSNAFSNYTPENLKDFSYIFYSEDGVYGSKDGEEFKRLGQQTTIHSGEQKTYPTFEELFKNHELYVRTYNCLRRNLAIFCLNNELGWEPKYTLLDLTKLRKNEVASFKNLGKVSLMEIENVMTKYGLKFKEENEHGTDK